MPAWQVILSEHERDHERVGRVSPGHGVAQGVDPVNAQVRDRSKGAQGHERQEHQVDRLERAVPAATQQGEEREREHEFAQVQRGDANVGKRSTEEGVADEQNGGCHDEDPGDPGADHQQGDRHGRDDDGQRSDGRISAVAAPTAIATTTNRIL